MKACYFFTTHQSSLDASRSLGSNLYDQKRGYKLLVVIVLVVLVSLTQAFPNYFEPYRPLSIGPQNIWVAHSKNRSLYFFGLSISSNDSSLQVRILPSLSS